MDLLEVNEEEKRTLREWKDAIATVNGYSVKKFQEEAEANDLEGNYYRLVK